MELEQMIQLIEAVSHSELTKFSYENQGVKLELRKEKEQVVLSAPVVADVAMTAIPQGQPMLQVSQGSSEAAQESLPQGNVITAPLVGTFYAASTPEDEPFVKVGDRVSKGQVLGILEAMKLMNEIESEYDGVVKEILVSNQQVVEYGQPMFVIE